jgi:hypothetical protein
MDRHPVRLSTNDQVREAVTWIDWLGAHLRILLLSLSFLFFLPKSCNFLIYRFNRLFKCLPE